MNPASASAHVKRPGPQPTSRTRTSAALAARGHRGFDQVADLRLEALVVAEARGDVVVDGVADREHPVEPPGDRADLPAS